MYSQLMRRAAICLALVAVFAAVLAAADILTQLGIPQAAAREEVMAGLGSGWFNYRLAAPAFKKAAPAVRAQLAEGAVAWAKAYTASPEFKASYEKLRQNRKPHAPQFKGTPEEEMARQLGEQAKDRAKGTEDMKKVMEQMSPEQRKQIEAALAQAEAIARQMDTPEMRKMQLDGIRAQRQDQTRRYEESLAKWQAEYPESPAPLIAKRLKTFLDVSSTVDFKAGLVAKGSVMRFANPEYEAKSAEWKLCYRAGQEAVAAARTAAQAWLKEIGS